MLHIKLKTFIYLCEQIKEKWSVSGHIQQQELPQFSLFSPSAQKYVLILVAIM